MTWLVTGAAGFIGSAVVRRLRADRPDDAVVSFDALTYAGRRENLARFDDDPAHTFVHGDVRDEAAVGRVFAEHDVTRVLHLAAETHVDRSLVDPRPFVETNVLGTATLLSAAASRWGRRDDVAFVQVSTDEVFGQLGATDPPFVATSPLRPRSPYAASKAGGDHLALAMFRSHDLPVVVSRCGNNYGPRQFPEKLVPVVVGRALRGEPVPIYGRGEQVRDWIHVDDHATALIALAEHGQPGRSYVISGGGERRNIDLVHSLLDAVDAELGQPAGTSRELVTFVADRPGHDFRYAIDDAETRRQIGWAPRHDLDSGLRDTVRWYCNHADWYDRARADGAAFERSWYGPRGVA